MKKLYTLTLIWVLCPLILTAQDHEACDGERYRLDIFEEVESTKALKFGEGTTFANAFQELYLDVYEPVGDQVDKRAVIVFAFGGSFLAGEREDMEFLCEIFAKKGFVTVTIDYRLYDGPLFPLPTAEDFQDVVTKAIGDMKAAVRFMVEDAYNANLFRIDPDNIFVGGISAGAITASHVAALDSTDNISDDLWALIDANGGIEGNSSDNYEYSTEVKGLINYSGALNDSEWIDENDPPMFSIHDEFDGVVPYGVGSATVFSIPIIEVHGSAVMHERATDIGIENQLFTVEESMQHISVFLPPIDLFTLDSLMNKTGDFAQGIICGEYISNTNTPYQEEFKLYPNPNSGQFTVQFDEVKQRIEFDIYSTTGRLISRIKTNPSDVVTVNTKLTAGIYIVKVLTEKGSAFRRIMIE